MQKIELQIEEILQYYPIGNMGSCGYELGYSRIKRFNKYTEN